MKATLGVLPVEHDAILDGVGLAVVIPLDNNLARLQAADDLQIGSDSVARRAEQIMGGELLQMQIDPLRQLVAFFARSDVRAEMLGDVLANFAQPFLFKELRMLAAEDQHGSVVEIGQQARFPIVPDARPDGRDVRDGQHIQHRQPLRACRPCG